MKKVFNLINMVKEVEELKDWFTKTSGELCDLEDEILYDPTRAEKIETLITEGRKKLCIGKAPVIWGGEYDNPFKQQILKDKYIKMYLLIEEIGKDIFGNVVDMDTTRVNHYYKKGQRLFEDAMGFEPITSL